MKWCRNTIAVSKIRKGIGMNDGGPRSDRGRRLSTSKLKAGKARRCGVQPVLRRLAASFLYGYHSQGIFNTVVLNGDVTPRRFRQLLEAASVLRFHKLQRLTRA